MLHIERVGVEVFEYQTSAGRKPFLEWIRQLKDRQGAIVIRNRINRIRLGHLGDCRCIGGSVWELRVFYGPGYRIYFVRDSVNSMILLCGGRKDSQAHDIEKAKAFAMDYWRRK